MAPGAAFKLVPMAETLLPSLPAAFFSSKPSLSLLPFLRSSKPLHFPCFRSSTSISFGEKLPLLPLVAQTSGWARQEVEEVEEEEIGEGGFGLEGFEEQSEDGGIVSQAEGQEEEEETYAQAPEEAKLYVGNLPYDIDSEKLALLFDKAGVVEVAEVIYNRQTDQSRGFGFVTMSTIEEAEKAVEMFHGYHWDTFSWFGERELAGVTKATQNNLDVNGRLLTVNRAAPRGARVERTLRASEGSFKIYVGNLPWQVGDGRLEQVFSEHGKVLEARVVYDRETGRSRGFGFVKMASQAEMDDAIAALDGQSLDGRALRVNVAEERTRNAAF